VSKGRQARGKKQQWQGVTEGMAAKQLRTSLLGDTKLSTRRHYGFVQTTTEQSGTAHSGLQITVSPAPQ
jgi:hypothetical protein